MVSEAVNKMIKDDHASTAPLKEFLEALEENPQLWWYLPTGHMQNLFEEAVDLLRENKLL